MSNNALICKSSVLKEMINRFPQYHFNIANLERISDSVYYYYIDNETCIKYNDGICLQTGTFYYYKKKDLSDYGYCFLELTKDDIITIIAWFPHTKVYADVYQFDKRSGKFIDAFINIKTRKNLKGHYITYDNKRVYLKA